jgi:hypothetical protein
VPKAQRLSLLLAKGVPQVCPSLLAHESISITMDLYTHWAPAIENHSAVAMEDILKEDIEVAGEGSEIGIGWPSGLQYGLQ